MKKNVIKPTAIDLFAGAGGLTCGLEKAGFQVVAAIEIEPEFAKTYLANHPHSKVIVTDIKKVSGKKIKEITGKKHFTLIAGCPPCQGFSSLTEKHKKIDPRNNLPLEMARLVEELEPDIVMMENVPGITKKGKQILSQFIKRLKNKGYKVNYDVLQLADYGVPQTRKRFVLMAGKGFSIPLPIPTHSKDGKKGRQWLTLKDALKDIKTPPVTLTEANETGGPKTYGWHVVRDISSITLARLCATKEGANRYELPERLRPSCHKHRNKGFGNVYGRLKWNDTPGTMTSGCTTLSMGRFGHPSEDRTISIKEAAAIQTFPKKYIFDTNFMDKAAIMVGNALPIKFAKLAAKSCMDAFLQQQNNL